MIIDVKLESVGHWLLNHLSYQRYVLCPIFFPYLVFSILIFKLKMTRFAEDQIKEDDINYCKNEECGDIETSRFLSQFLHRFECKERALLKRSRLLEKSLNNNNNDRLLTALHRAHCWLWGSNEKEPVNVVQLVLASVQLLKMEGRLIHSFHKNCFFFSKMLLMAYIMLQK
jgi:hypothetical protein